MHCTVLLGLLVGSALALVQAQVPPVPVNPARPSPNWNWDTIPVAFHGANRSGMYNEETIDTLAKFNMVTIEKWYTPCGSKGPQQAGPECDVEAKMFDTFAKLKQLKPNITTIMYLNSMFDFAFYHLHGDMMAREAKGEKSFLRDRHGDIVELCNDGNVYCNITTFDHTNQAVNQLWTDALRNATKDGHVDGVFADHAYNNPKGNGDYPELCNGKGAGRKCWEFEKEFATTFIQGHNWLLNNTQDWLSKTTGGPVVCGAYSRWNVATDFAGLQKVARKGVEDHTAPFVLEANRGSMDVLTDESKLAGYLCAMEKYTYLSFFTGAPPSGIFDEGSVATKPLGKPQNVCMETPSGSGLWERNFSSSKGVTVVKYDSKSNRGSVWFAGDPKPTPSPPTPPAPPTPPPSPAPAYCGKPLMDTGMANADILAKPTGSYSECCELCHTTEKCVIWAWHHEQGGMCHFHTAAAIRDTKKGCVSGYVNGTGTETRLLL